MSIVPYIFENNEIRVVGTPENPLFVASDVCKVLGIDTSVSVNGQNKKDKDGNTYRSGGLDEDEKTTHIVSTPSGDYEMLVVTEPGLYILISKSRKEIGKRFRRWVFHEVIPSIRKTGKYEAPKVKQKPQIPADVQAARVSNNIVKIHNNLAPLDPRLAQILIDYSMRDVLSISGTESEPLKDDRLAGVVEIAVDLGFTVGKEESVLGRAVAKKWREAYNTEPQVSNRECGGAFRGLKAYPFNDQVVRDTITAFYEKRNSA